MNRHLWSGMCLAPLLLGALQSVGPTAEDDYLNGKGSDPISVLQSRIYAGKTRLQFEPTQGFLRSLLQELHISPSSQLLVFSKTSLQTPYITPYTPRAIYFNDRTYIGWIKGAPYIEISSVDPVRGPMFYTLRNVPQPRPIFTHQTYECLQCHESSMSSHVPGVMMRSVFAGGDGMPRLASGSFVTTDQSPLSERWGGWYVTGTHGAQRHMGNEVAKGDENSSHIDTEKGANVTDLRSYIDTDVFLTPHSDIVALMVAEKQMVIQNLITKASFLTRNALRDEEIFSPKEFASHRHTESTLGRIRHACEPLVLAMVCSGEVKLTSPVVGTSRFALDYSQSAPKDKLGRSLSDLDLHTRLLRYPCSPMVYSEAFDCLPKEARAEVWRIFREILSGDKPSQVQLSETDRSAVSQILLATKPEFAQAVYGPHG